ncbi:MAG: phosphoribosylformylglycinamidine synthase [Gemmatimonadota bacterium]|nr:phosphoribosylformylglycinamidine synthase [Gemmatimonadota bacterium]
MRILHFYRTPALAEPARRSLLARARDEAVPGLLDLATEHCFHVGVAAPPGPAGLEVLHWLLAETFEPAAFGPRSFLAEPAPGPETLGPAREIVEVGPRLAFTTAWSTNAVAVCHACGLPEVRRIERSRRYRLLLRGPLSPAERSAFLALVHDRMTECPYAGPLTSFAPDARPAPVRRIPLRSGGREELERVNRELGLAFDERDLAYYLELFRDRLRRDPTDVELFDVAQSNSEHSRHWFFKGRLVVDGEERPRSLMEVLRAPLEADPRNSVIAFRDNSSAIRGFRVPTVLPRAPGAPSPFVADEPLYHLLFTAETHNFPSGVAPFPGAETGAGGRIRDVHATGRGSLVVAGTAGYAVGDLRIPGALRPWEDETARRPENLAPPLEILLRASDGASDYGNKFGEPLVQGFARGFAQRLPDGERRAWLKPIMFSGGIGQIDARHVEKGRPEPGMAVVKIGGPAYRIGLGGGAASSMVQGENLAELDFHAVQRGDAEMEQKVNRVLRACVELGEANPIVSIHDQGAGGNCNVLKEIVDPEGAVIEVRAIPVGDETLSVLEIWGAEYQENDALLLRPEDEARFDALCAREKVPWAVVGRVTGDGRIVLHDAADGSRPVDLALQDVLGDMPAKRFELTRRTPRRKPLRLPAGLGVDEALDRVLRLVSVGSKRFLTTKVDRSVTGLVARQQTAGPLQLTVADVAVIAQGHFGVTGGATAIGEQPLKSLLDPAAMARLCVGEALTNLVWAPITDLRDVKCSGNWMWAAKLPGEGAALADAVDALAGSLAALGIAIDGGKDSLSMAALAPGPDGAPETVKSPGTLVLSAYAPCPDITRTVTPDLARPGRGRLLFVDLARGAHRLGGSALAQCFGQVGDEVPDLEDPDLVARAFGVVQGLIREDRVAAGHDRSDGGLVVTLLEMAFAGNVGVAVDLPDDPDDALPALFAEELGLVLEVDEADLDVALAAFADAEVPCLEIGRVTEDPGVSIRLSGEAVLRADLRDLRDAWEATSFALDALQADPELVDEERRGLRARRAPRWEAPFAEALAVPEILAPGARPAVAVLREEGSNSDREMASAFHAAGLEPWDVTMTDLLAGRTTLERFRGIAFVGGFSFADVLDSAKGWAGVIRFHPEVAAQFEAFRARPDTFSLGVCNGCQLSALLGWVPWRGIEMHRQPRFVRNASGRFESRFVTVRVEPGPAVLLRGLEGATLGIWSVHGEGRAHFPDPEILERVQAEGLAPVRYAGDDGRATGRYPFNPNGSPGGIAALCSADGRHLAIMPHPERAFRLWQWPWLPRDVAARMREAAGRGEAASSPWLQVFRNAREWCDQTA